ncbi:MAG: hypothetical protein ACMXYG_00745 [Candidatus Woesearchaeota archaeon]
MEAVFRGTKIVNDKKLGPIIIGKIIAGTLRIGMQTKIDKKMMDVYSIELNLKTVKEAQQNDMVALLLNEGEHKKLKKIIGNNIMFIDPGQDIKNTVVYEKKNIKEVISEKYYDKKGNQKQIKPNHPKGLISSIIELFKIKKK